MIILAIVLWIICGVLSRLLSKGFYYHRYHMLGWSKKEEAFHWVMALGGPFNLVIVSLFFSRFVSGVGFRQWTLKW